MMRFELIAKIEDDITKELDRYYGLKRQNWQAYVRHTRVMQQLHVKLTGQLEIVRNTGKPHV